MIDIILQVIMIGAAFLAGYSVCQLRHPERKRDLKGRFIKKD